MRGPEPANSQPRERNWMPRREAFCDVAATVRFSFFAIATPESFALASDRNCFTSAGVQRLNFDFFIVATKFGACIVAGSVGSDSVYFVIDFDW